MYITESAEDGLIAVELTQNIPGQKDFYGGEQEEPKFILLKKEA